MREIFYTFLNWFTGLVKLFYKYNLRVIAYHEIPDKVKFIEHIEYLQSNYTIIDIDYLKEHLSTNKKLPKYPLLITFDDGYKNIFDNAVPVLINRKLPACIFIITSYVNSQKQFWWKSSYKYYKESGLSNKDAKARNVKLKQMSNKERLAILKKIGTNNNELQVSSNYLKQIERKNIVLGNHTDTHPILDRCSVSEVQEEIKNAQKKFESWGISGKNIFAYPNGNRSNKIEEVLRKNNIEMAFLFDHKINKTSINPFQISRISTNASMSIKELKVKVSGLHSLISNLR